MSFCFVCDVHYWCQVWRPLLQCFQRYSWFSILLFMWNNLWHHHFPHLHNTKTRISLKRKKIFQNRKSHSSWLWKPFQKSSNYFLLHRHFKFCLKCLKTISIYHNYRKLSFKATKTYKWIYCTLTSLQSTVSILLHPPLGILNIGTQGVQELFFVNWKVSEIAELNRWHVKCFIKKAKVIWHVSKLI